MFGERLKQERQRLCMNQDDFAEVGGVKKRAQISYEKDERSPDAAYLSALLKIGVDVWYVMTGNASSATLSSDESELLAGYRGLDVRGKAGVLGMIDGMKAPSPAKTALPKPGAASPTVVFHGKVGQQITGDITAPQTINMANRKKK